MSETTNGMELIRKNITKLENKLTSFGIDPEIWKNEIMGVISISNKHSTSKDLGNSIESIDYLAFDRKTDRSSSSCHCGEENNKNAQISEMKSKLIESRMRIISLNQQQEDYINDLAERDSLIVKLEDQIFDLSNELMTNKNECQAHVSVIQELTSSYKKLNI